MKTFLVGAMLVVLGWLLPIGLLHFFNYEMNVYLALGILFLGFIFQFIALDQLRRRLNVVLFQLEAIMKSASLYAELEELRLAKEQRN